MELILAFIAGVFVGEFGLLFVMGLFSVAKDKVTD